MALDLTTAIVSDLAGRVLASSLVSMQCALAARSPCWLGRADQPSLLPLHAERCPEPRAHVARRKPSLDDQRGACHIGVKLASYGIADIRLSFASGMGEASMHVGGGLQEVMESDAADDGDQQHTSGDVPHAPERRGISS